MNTADAYRKGWDDFKAGVNSPPKELDVYDIVAWSQGREDAREDSAKAKAAAEPNNHLEATRKWLVATGETLVKRNDTKGQHQQMLHEALGLMLNIGFCAANLLLTLAVDLRAIRTKLGA